MNSDGGQAGGPPPASTQARNLNWLLSDFVEKTLSIEEAVAVSADGFLLAQSQGSKQEAVEQLAAIIAGLTSLARGASDIYDYGEVAQLIIEMRSGYFFVMSINDGSTFGVLANHDCDVGHVAYEMALLVERAGAVLTPALIDELKNTIPIEPRGGAII